MQLRSQDKADHSLAPSDRASTRAAWKKLGASQRLRRGGCWQQGIFHALVSACRRLALVHVNLISSLVSRARLSPLTLHLCSPIFRVRKLDTKPPAACPGAVAHSVRRDRLLARLSRVPPRLGWWPGPSRLALRSSQALPTDPQYSPPSGKDRT